MLSNNKTSKNYHDKHTYGPSASLDAEIIEHYVSNGIGLREIFYPPPVNVLDSLILLDERVNFGKKMVYVYNRRSNDVYKVHILECLKKEPDKLEELVLVEVINELNGKQKIPVSINGISLTKESVNSYNGTITCSEPRRTWKSDIEVCVFDDKVTWRIHFVERVEEYHFYLNSKRVDKSCSGKYCTVPNDMMQLLIEDKSVISYFTELINR